MKKLFGVLIFLICFGAITVTATELPILMYHSMDYENGLYSVTPEKFESDMQSLRDAGYTTVSFQEVMAFVNEGQPLPEKPVIVTFDDGYPNNADTLLPLAERLGVKVEVFLVAGFVEYSPLGMSWEQARLIDASPNGAVGCHTYNLHSTDTRKRLGVVRTENESFREWEHMFRYDLALAKYFFKENSLEVTAFAYPYGSFSAEADRILRESGYKVTVTTEKGINKIEVGDIESLYLMMRISMDGVANSAAEEIAKYEGIYTTEKIMNAKMNVWNEINASRKEALLAIFDSEYFKNTQKTYKFDYYYDMKYQDDETKALFAWCMEFGVISGYPNNTLGPDYYITRGEFALILARSRGYEGEAPTHFFTDSQDWNAGALSWCYEMGYMIGYGDEFGVNDFLTKEQIEIVCRRMRV